MNNEVLEFAKAEAKKLIDAPTSCAEVKDAASAWLAAVGTDQEAAETKKFVAELEEDIIPIDGLIAFAESETGAKVFGDKAPEVAGHGRKIKAEGAKYCDCPACAACEAILAKKAELLA
ncbi:MAG: molecular chaperone Hsp90 [Eubacteriales bacterium]|nr:molecular chaperone Hsp90 [Eubacteriales bacterium]